MVSDEFGHERFTGVAAQLAVEVEKRIKDVLGRVLGRIQRGGTPTAYLIERRPPDSG